MEAKCVVCGAAFERPPSVILAGKVRYCSNACKAEAQKRRVVVACRGCGRAMERTPCQVRAAKGYCGAACWKRSVTREARPPVRFDGETVLIPLSQGKWARVDRADYDGIPELRENWSAVWNPSSRTFYAIRRVGRKAIWMHRVIAGAPDDMDVNHRDFDGLNNARENIEVCTRTESQQYRRKVRKGSNGEVTSRFKGVSWNRGKWAARLGPEVLGRFASEEDAAAAYDRAAAASYGRFAKLNEPDESTGVSPSNS